LSPNNVFCSGGVRDFGRPPRLNTPTQRNKSREQFIKQLLCPLFYALAHQDKPSEHGATEMAS